MKKLIFSLAIALTAAMTVNAQEVGEANVPYLTLNNGAKMPQFGLGTYQVPTNEVCKDAVLTALRAGYRHIDTAHAYMDERGVGEAINEFVAEGGCKREDIWVTSKIWPSEYNDPTAIDRMLAA
jgi:diketogulonate reductase-like aldo/keto reductase